jgi:hypothetical protein
MVEGETTPNKLGQGQKEEEKGLSRLKSCYCIDLTIETNLRA